MKNSKTKIDTQVVLGQYPSLDNSLEAQTSPNSNQLFASPQQMATTVWVSDIKQLPVEKITNGAFTALFSVLLQGDESASYFPFFAPGFCNET